MDMQRDVLDRLYRNQVLQQEAEQHRRFRAAYHPEPRPNLVRFALALFGRGLVWLWTRLEAQYDCYKLRAASQPC